MSDQPEELARITWDSLQRIVRELLSRKAGGHLVEARLETLDLRLPLSLNGSGAAPSDFSRTLVGMIDELLDDAIQQAAAFRPGHAYCHRCEGVVCEHSAPPSGRHVFAGYTPTGLPRWEDFAQYCLDRGHPQVDRLFDEHPAMVTLIQSRSTLQGGMLQAFRTESYEVLGQLMAGFFPVKARADEGRGVLALTAQVAGSTTRRGSLMLGLNVLGRTPSGENLERLWDRHQELPWRKSIRWAQQALQTVSPRVRGGRVCDRVADRVEGILSGLARRLERDQRSRSRRTRHAQRRHASGQRPTRKALDDARVAGDGAVLLDERSDTLVVLGDRGRTHFFTREGQHVSSVRYSGEAIERKLRLEQWRPAPAEALEVLRAKLPS